MNLSNAYPVNIRNRNWATHWASCRQILSSFFGRACSTLFIDKVIQNGQWDLANDTHYNDVIMSVMVSQITCVCSLVGSGADQRHIKAPGHGPLCGEFTGEKWVALNLPVTCGFCSQLARDSENIFMSWCHDICRWNFQKMIQLI